MVLWLVLPHRALAKPCRNLIHSIQKRLFRRRNASPH